MDEGLNAFKDAFGNAVEKWSGFHQPFLGRIRDEGNLGQNTRHRGESQDVEGPRLHAMIDDFIMGVEMTDERLLGGPGEFQ